MLMSGTARTRAKNLKRSLAAGLLSAAAAALWAEGPAPAPQAGPSARTGDAASILGSAVLAEARRDGRAVRTGSAPSILPEHSAAAGLRQVVASEKPGIVVESTFVLPRAKPADPAKAKAELAAIYGTMRSFGSMRGIEYYSASRKKMRTLYVESYRIGDERKRDQLPDPAAPQPDGIPADETCLAYQEDLSLGANVYSYHFTSFPDAVLVEATNLTRMSYGIFPAVAPGGFRTRVLVIQADDAIIFYALSSAVAPSIVRGKVGESLANRAEALYRWFSSKAASF